MGSSFDRVALLSVETLEPLVIRDKYCKGAHYFSPPYLPSSTLSGAILSHLIRRGKLSKPEGIWMSHAFPGSRDGKVPPFRLGEPPPLPLATISRSESGEYVSVALMFAKAMRDGPSILKEVKALSRKVEPLFFKGTKDAFRPPEKEVYTHVALNYEGRTYAYEKVGEEKYGLLFTEEIIRPGSRFFAIAFLNESVHEALGDKLTVRIGASIKKGLGLSEVKVEEWLNLEEYRKRRMDKIGKHSNEDFLTVDVVTHTDRCVLSALKEPIYEKVIVSNFKSWFRGNFYIYRRLMGPGSVLVYPRADVEKAVELELTPPPDNLRRIQGLDMVFFDNDIHFDSLSVLGGGLGDEIR